MVLIALKVNSKARKEGGLDLSYLVAEPNI